MQSKPTTRGQCAAPGCDNYACGLGYCQKHYSRLRRHGDINYERPTMARNFWAHVEKTESCWNWKGAVDRRYGCLSINGRMTKAHRYAWELSHGPIPEHLLVCHHCDNPLCVRPDHLFLGTHRDNMRDMVAKGRAASGDRIATRSRPELRCFGDRNGSRRHPERLARGDRNPARLHPEKMARGERNGASKLTTEGVRQMRALYATGALSIEAVATQFGVSYAAAWMVINRRTWRHVLP